MYADVPAKQPGRAAGAARPVRADPRAVGRVGIVGALHRQLHSTGGADVFQIDDAVECRDRDERFRVGRVAKVLPDKSVKVEFRDRGSIVQRPPYVRCVPSALSTLC